MMMNRIGKFHKVSFERFAEDWQDTFGETAKEELERIYGEIKLPARATSVLPDTISILRQRLF